MGPEPAAGAAPLTRAGGHALVDGGRPLAWLVGGSLAVKLLLVWMVAAMPCSHDQCEYLELADGILAGRGLQVHDGYLWPPGYIGFLALCRGLFGADLTAPRLLQVLASTACVPLMFLIGRRLFDRRTGLAAAAAFAFYPNLVAFTHYFWPSTLYILWLLLAFHFLVRSHRVSPRDAVAAGLWLGVAALFKGQALYFAPLAAAWIAWCGGAGAREEEAAPVAESTPVPAAPGRLVVAALLVGATLVPVLPWTVRNALTYHRFLLLDATTGRNLYIGTNVPPPSNWDYGFDERRRVHGGRPRCADANVVDADRCETRNAIRFVLEHPGLTLARVPMKLADLLNPSSFLIRHARLGKYPHVFSRWEIILLTLMAAGAWMALAALGTAGLALLPRVPGRALVVTLLAYHLAVHVATFGMTRFRLPMVPFLVLFAAPLLTRPWGPLLAAAPAWRRAAALAGVMALVLLWASRWRQVFDVLIPA